MKQYLKDKLQQIARKAIEFARNKSFSEYLSYKNRRSLGLLVVNVLSIATTVISLIVASLSLGIVINVGAGLILAALTVVSFFMIYKMIIKPSIFEESYLQVNYDEINLEQAKQNRNATILRGVISIIPAVIGMVVAVGLLFTPAVVTGIPMLLLIASSINLGLALLNTIVPIYKAHKLVKQIEQRDSHLQDQSTSITSGSYALCQHHLPRQQHLVVSVSAEPVSSESKNVFSILQRDEGITHHCDDSEAKVLGLR